MLGEAKVGRVLEQGGCVRVSVVFQVEIQVSEEDEGVRVKAQGCNEMCNRTGEVVAWSRWKADEGATQGEVGCDVELKGQVVHVAGSHIGGGGTADGFLEDNGDSASGFV